MDILIAWWTGRPTVNAFYLRPVAKAEGTGSTSFILLLLPVVQLRNCHLLMPSLVHIHPTENRWPLFLSRRHFATGRDTVAAGRRVFRFSILQITVHKTSPPMKQQEMNSRCGMEIIF